MTKQTKILGENTRLTKYNPNLAQQITRQMEIEEQQARLNPKTKKEKTNQPSEESINHSELPAIKEGYIYVPVIGIYVAKQRTFEKNNWYNCQRLLKENGQRMLTISEFIRFVRHVKGDTKYIRDATEDEIEYIRDDILTIRNPPRGDWLDARFYEQKRKMEIGYPHKFENGLIIAKNSELLEKCLGQDQISTGIDFNSWLNNSTSQGLPETNIAKGDLAYSSPKELCVAGFGINNMLIHFNCAIDPFRDRHDSYGVHAVKLSNPTD